MALKYTEMTQHDVPVTTHSSVLSGGFLACLEDGLQKCSSQLQSSIPLPKLLEKILNVRVSQILMLLCNHQWQLLWLSLML